MKKPLYMHLFVALVWLFLSGNPTFGNFAVAFVGTFCLLALFRKAIGCEPYIRRVRGLIVFLVLFIREVIHANVAIMLLTMKRDAKDVHGEFIQYCVEDLTDFESLLIAYCIGLSPGTIAADRSEDGKYLVLHTFGIGDADSTRRIIDRTLRDRILAFTR